MADRAPLVAPAWLRAPLPVAQRLPAGLALVAIVGQIVYPHTEGAGRDRLTIATVVLLAGASLLHVGATRGWQSALRALAVLGGGGLLAELAGVATGFPFGDYAYADRLGPMVGDVPLLIPLAWAMLGWPAAVVAERVTRDAGLWPFLAVGAVALTTWDLFLDPQMVAEGYWTWADPDPALLPGIPAVNYLGWLVVSAVMMLGLRPIVEQDGPADRDDRLPIGLYLWTWIGSVIAHLFYLDLPVSGVVGGLGMGAVVGLLAWRAGGPAAGSVARTEQHRSEIT